MNRRWMIVIVSVLLSVVAACSATTTASPEQASSATLPSLEATVTPPPVLPSTPPPTPAAPAESTVPPSPTDVPASAVPVSASEEADDNSVVARADGEPTNAAPASGDIADVDFENGFAYPGPFEEPEPIVVTDGENESGSFADFDYLGFFVAGVRYGDLDGDGRDEAVVATSLNGGGTGWFDALHAYGIADGEVVRLGTAHLGDRAHGGLWHHEITDDHLLVETFDTDLGACCPSMIVRTRYALGNDGLLVAERAPTLRWLSLDGYTIDGAPGVPELRFVAGTSAAVLDLPRYDATMAASLDAVPGQHVEIRHVRGERPTMVELVDRNGSVVAAASPASDDTTLFDAVISSTGPWQLSFTFASGSRSDDSVVLAAITDERATSAIDWSATVRHVVVADEPQLVFQASLPTFAIDDGGRANAAVRIWLERQTDWWIADAVEYPPVDRGDGTDPLGEYSWSHDVTLANERYVAVHWDWYEYVCCRPYPNYGNRAIVVDLADGRLVDDDEILDLSRVDEIHERWLDAHEREHDFRLDNTYWTGPGWTSLSVVPGGVRFGNDRQGALGASETFVSWGELDDLARPGFVDAVRASQPAPAW